MPSRHTAVLVILVVLGACQFSEDRYIRRIVRPDELVGTWRATEYAIKSLRDLGHKDHLERGDHEMTLRSDGTCSIKTVFNVHLAWDSDPDYREYDTDCTWHLSDVGPHPSDVRYQSLRFELTPPPKKGVSFYFAEEQGQLIIWKYATDPDAWRYLEFERIDEAPNVGVNLSVRPVTVLADRARSAPVRPAGYAWR